MKVAFSEIKSQTNAHFDSLKKRTLKCLNVEIRLVICSGVGGRGASAPQKFWFVKNLGKIYENVCKIPEILGKQPENMEKRRPTLFDFEQRAPRVGKITWRPFLWRSSQNWSVWKEIFTQRVARKVFGQVWGNSGKNLSKPQKFTCSYTYGWLPLPIKISGYAPCSDT